MSIDLSGKTATVTGSTAGIGSAIASGLAAAGAEVIINGRTADGVERAASELAESAGAQGRVRGVAADVGHRRGMRGADRRAPRRGCARQQRRRLRTAAGVRDLGSGVDGAIRDQRYERDPPQPSLRPEDGRAGLGPGDLHLQRVGASRPPRHGPLRDDQDRPTRDLARLRRVGRRGAA